MAVGASGSGQAAAGDRAGEDLHAGVLVRAEAGGGGEQGPDGVGVEVGTDRQRLGPGQAQLPGHHDLPLPGRTRR